jgi:hypothetical protein
MPYLHAVGEPQLYGTQEETIAAMKTLIKNYEAKGYKSKPHPTEKNRFMLTHPTEGYVDVYVDDDA